METVTTAAFPVTPTPVDAIEWRYRPGDAEAHAFGEGRGWMRAKCKRIPLTIALIDAPDDFPRCADCRSIVDPRIPLERCTGLSPECPHFECPDGWHAGDAPNCSCTPDCALPELELHLLDGNR